VTVFLRWERALKEEGEPTIPPHRLVDPFTLPGAF